MKEFNNVRELLGQIGIDLEAKAGRIGKSFRIGIRKELEQLGREKGTAKVSIVPMSSGSFVTLHIEDWVERKDRDLIEQQFKDLMDRFGATTTGTCSGVVPGSLMTFIGQVACSL
jgi:hypothetical protein